MEYSVKRSSRKTLSIEITADCQVLVRAPDRMSDRIISEFVADNTQWIENKLDLQRKKAGYNARIDEMKNQLKDAAECIIPQLVDRYSVIMNLKPASVKITSAKKRFGSCSGKNALCFSWRLMAYPKEAVDYVVVHELAHIKHHNHSPQFYRTIEKYMPDYKERIKLLKKTICNDLTNTYL